MTSTDALAERLFMAAIHTLEIASVHVGGRLGFYRALAEGGAATPAELAARTGTAERYVREWLEQQAVAGFVDVDDPAADAGARRYTLPDAHHAVFVDEESLSHLTGLAQLVVGVLRPIDELIEAYRSGAGVPYPAYGADTVAGIAATNRPQFHNLLADWFAAVPEIDARLRADPPARVADLGCGTGWSSIAIARAYPKATVEAIDADADSIEATRRNVGAAGLADRVRPVIHGAGEAKLPGRYDLVTIFEALHDMNHPSRRCKSARDSLADGGAVLVADERVGGSLHRAGRRDRALRLRIQRPALPAGREPGRGLRGDRHRDPQRHGARLRHPGRLRERRGAAHRPRLLALLPAHGLTAGDGVRRPR